MFRDLIDSASFDFAAAYAEFQCLAQVDWSPWDNAECWITIRSIQRPSMNPSTAGQKKDARGQ